MSFTKRRTFFFIYLHKIHTHIHWYRYASFPLATILINLFRFSHIHQSLQAYLSVSARYSWLDLFPERPQFGYGSYLTADRYIVASLTKTEIGETLLDASTAWSVYDLIPPLIGIWWRRFTRQKLTKGSSYQGYQPKDTLLDIGLPEVRQTDRSAFSSNAFPRTRPGRHSILLEV